jgi:hypothetical protein
MIGAFFMPAKIRNNVTLLAVRASFL